ncbi:XRE family transcriptional regulator [Lacrimispora amygdalina]|uniref:XRE family transcriptional regulator n=1 Tax=Lacrimispora amygdalina TaxID=253257 RepID=A0A3E2NB85_9FIRM|nr:helix-turn-helix transcriptional regulator [Clostridium indicum]RFZ78278.1 XRE family transcriptional regulator [Clostridium indicum]
MRLNIKDKMKEKNLNRHQLSMLINVGYPTINAIYNGKTASISFEILESICRVLECTPNDIIISDDPTVSRLLLYADKIQRDEQKEKDDSE